MKISARSGAAVLASIVSLSLVACGGGSTPATGGGGDAGGTGASTSTTSTTAGGGSGGTGGGGSSSSSSGWTGAPVTVTLDGVPTDLATVEVTHPMPGWVAFDAYKADDITNLQIWANKSTKTGTGTWPCTNAVGWMSYVAASGDIYNTTNAVGECAITFDQVATAPGEMWVGTFTATLVAKDGSGQTAILTDGTFHLVEP
jgi:hypothetical protein